MSKPCGGAIASVIASAFFFSNPANPDPVIVNFNGVVDEVIDTTLDSELMGQFDVGDSFSGTLTYDDSELACGDTSAVLSGETFGGDAITGTDSLNTVGCR